MGRIYDWTEEKAAYRKDVQAALANNDLALKIENTRRGGRPRTVTTPFFLNGVT